MKAFFTSVTLLITAICFSQDSTWKKNTDTNAVVVHKDPRLEAIAAKTKVYTYFPELKAYMWHQSPYYKLKVGNFKERKDAEAYQKKLSVFFPKGVFIMPDKVEIKPGKGNESELDIKP